MKCRAQCSAALHKVDHRISINISGQVPGTAETGCLLGNFDVRSFPSRWQQKLQSAAQLRAPRQHLTTRGAAGTPPLRLLSKALHAWIAHGELSLEELAGALSQGCEAPMPPRCMEHGCGHLAACVASLPPSPSACKPGTSVEQQRGERQPTVDALNAARGFEHPPTALDVALQRLLNCVLRPLPVGDAAALAAVALAGINQVRN